MPNPRDEAAAAAREALFAAAEVYVNCHRRAAIVVAENAVELFVAGTPAAPAEGASAYDAAILAALTDSPVSARRLARAAQHRYNSYFRERLAELVASGRIRRDRRGYSRPPD